MTEDGPAASEAALGGPPAVQALELTRRYGDRLALAGITLSVAPGEVFALLGPNGGGKTTLFKILSTLVPASSGRFLVCGQESRNLTAIRRLLGVVFQSPSLDRKLSVLENVLLQGRLYGLSGEDLRRRAFALLARFGIADRRDDLVETLSGGLARRVEIAKALLHGPRVLLLDEPSTGLDPGARRDLRQTLLELARKEGAAVLLTTHLFEEADAADRVAILDRGRLVAEGTPAGLKAQVGGDVLSVETAGEAEARRLAEAVVTRFGASAGSVSAVASAVRLERRAAHELVPALVEAFPGGFRSVTLGAPSLEDVFVDRTGHRFEEAGEAA